jgi:hypothetical protein
MQEDTVGRRHAVDACGFRGLLLVLVWLWFWVLDCWVG